MTIPTITDDILAEIESDFDPHRSNAELMEAGEDWAPYIPMVIQRLRQLEKDAALLDGLDTLCEGYGTHEHEGNEWKVWGPFSNVRDAIAYAMQGDL